MLCFIVPSLLNQLLMPKSAEEAVKSAKAGYLPTVAVKSWSWL